MILSEASQALWSPRARASRAQQLLEVFKGTESGRIQRRGIAKLMAFNFGLFALMKAQYGDDVEFITDPKRSDFMKIRKGNTTVDPWVGIGPMIRAGAKLYYGGAKSPHTGKEYPITPGGAIGDYLVSGISPGISLIWEGLTGKTTLGWPQNRFEALANLTPLSSREIKEVYDEEGLEGIFFMLMTISGEGVDVWNNEKEKAKRRELEGKPSLGKGGRKKFL